ncbi:MAG: PAS domain-containing protein [Planctomycetaceae bacterium]|jgi:PAS domain S-box-containing protein|nr:PAS domain-containing protein [Planctomycetaceae bacterium]
MTHISSNNTELTASADSASQPEELVLPDLFTVISDGLVCIDRTFHIRKKNDAFVQMFPCADLEKQHCYEILHQRSEPCGDCMICAGLQGRTRAGEKIRFFEYPRESTGKGRWLRSNVFPILDKDGGVNGVLTILRDITENKQLLERLHADEERHKSFFTAMTNGAVIAAVVRDETGRPADYTITDINETELKRYGKTIQEVQGRSLLSLYSGISVTSHDTGDKWRQGIEDAADGKSGIYHIYNSDLSDGYSEVVVFPIGQNFIGLLIYNETARILAESFRTRSQAVIEHSAFPVCWVDIDGTILYGNEAARQAAGYYEFTATLSSQNEKQASGKKSAYFFNQWISSEKDWIKFVEQLRQRKNMTFETCLKRYDGTTYMALATCDYIVTPELTDFIAMTWCNLSDQIKLIEAEHGEKFKTRFLAHISQEIKTPLNELFAAVEHLKQQCRNKSQLGAVAAVQSIEKRLLTVVGNVLDLTNFDEGQIVIQPQPFDLPYLIQDVADIVSPQAEKKNIHFSLHFETELPKDVFGAPERLRQVLITLLSYNINLTQEGDVGLTAAFGSWKMHKGISYAEIRFDITDTGHIDSDQRNRIAKMFSLSSSDDAESVAADSSADAGGQQYLGIGTSLLLAKRIVELMGGTLTAESGQNTGSHFCILLPMQVVPKTISDKDNDASRGFWTKWIKPWFNCNEKENTPA